MLCVASNMKLSGMDLVAGSGERSISGMVVTAGAGALAAAAGMYVFKKIKAKRNKAKVKLTRHSHLSLSTRCTWLISELGAEADFEMVGTTEGPPPQAFLNTPLSLTAPHPPSLGALPHTEPPTENKYGLVEFTPYTSEDEELMEYDYDSDSSLPRGASMPALVVNDDFTMIEGAALCMYLADLYQQFLPQPDYKAEYYSWITYSASTYDDILKTLQEQLVDSPVRRRNPALLEPALKGFHTFTHAMEDALTTRQYICGDKFTAADCVVGFTLYWAYTIENGQLLEGYPNIIAYLKRLRNRPAFKKTFGKEEEWQWGRFFYSYVRGIKR